MTYRCIMKGSLDYTFHYHDIDLVHNVVYIAGGGGAIQRHSALVRWYCLLNNPISQPLLYRRQLGTALLELHYYVLLPQVLCILCTTLGFFLVLQFQTRALDEKLRTKNCRSSIVHRAATGGKEAKAWSSAGLRNRKWQRQWWRAG